MQPFITLNFFYTLLIMIVTEKVVFIYKICGEKLDCMIGVVGENAIKSI